MDTIKRNVKDSLFTHMFGDDSKEYLLQLYQALHPEDNESNVEDLDLISIENALTNDIYNDLGFTVNNRLVILVEAQSTWSENILIRLLMYLGKTYQAYIYGKPELKAKIYSETKLKIPKAEMYVIYAGTQGNRPSVLSFKEEFLGEDGNIDLIAKVIYADENRDDIIGQYLAFCTILKAQLRVYNGDKKKAIQVAIDICINEGNLVKYLSEHRREVEDYMFALLSDEELKQAYGDYRKSIGVQQERLSSIKNVMESFNLSAEEAMKSLKIPEEQQDQYLELLK